MTDQLTLLPRCICNFRIEATVIDEDSYQHIEIGSDN